MLPMPFNNPDDDSDRDTPHSGVDFGQPMWTPIPASGPGVIYGNAYNDRCGYGLWVSYDGYPDVLYCHLPADGWRAPAGTRVNEGDTIAYVGSTGNSSGPHVHVEVEFHPGRDGFFTYFDSNRWVGGGSGGGGGSVEKWPARAKYGADWVVGAQKKLMLLGYDVGPDGADGYDGPATQAATLNLQNRGGLTPDGIFGPDTNAYADELLTTPPTGTPPFPLPAGSYFGPEGGPAESVSGWHGNARDLARWQQKMKDRGREIDVDGYYGRIGDTTPEQSETGRVALAFQKEKGLKADGLIGPDTWKAAWEAPVTPPAGGGGTDPQPPATAAGRNATLDKDSLVPPRATKDIQAFLKVPQTDVWDQATSDATLAFQRSWEIDEDRIWGITCDGLAFPPAGNHGLGADWSFSRPDGAKLQRHGLVPIGRYLWNPLYADGRTNKGISGAEYAEHIAAGRQPFFYYEEDSTDPIRGFDEGVRQAKAAEVHRIREGLPALPINFPVDFDAPASDFPAILDGLRGAATVVGLERTWLYGKYAIIKAAFDAGVISGACQTYAWSLDANGHIQWDPRAQLRQWSNGQWSDSIDFVYAMAAEFGQNPPKTPQPDVIELDRSEVAEVAAEAQALAARIAGWLK